ncbi:MAG: hypothetical protein F6K21_10210 [Symploca sp. SIO2D2]|nr:hypothetical protein [Symploca sp. SIO2D2]
MGALDQAAQDALSSIFTVEQFKTFLIDNLGITLLNNVVLATIANEFHLGQLSYNYVNEPPESQHQFLWAATINVAPDDEVSDISEEPQNVNAINANLLIQVEDRTGEQEGLYGGTIDIPLGDSITYTPTESEDGETEYIAEYDDGTLVLRFTLFFQNKKSPGQSPFSSIITASLAAEQSLEIALQDLISTISFGLSDLIPVELLSYFKVNSTIVMVIDCPANSSGSNSNTAVVKKRSMLFSIGFNGRILFNDIPLVDQALTPSIADSEFAFEFLVALQEFSRKQLMQVNYFLEEVGVPLRIKPPCNSTNVLKRGASIGAHFEIGPYAKAWLTPLSRPKTTTPPPPAKPSSSLVPTSDVQVLAASSSNVSSNDEELPITITENGAWLTVQKSFGPLHFEKVGLTYKNQKINLTPQLVVEVSRMVMTLNGLSIGSPLMEFSPSFNLDGFGLEVITSGLEIGGTFLLVEGSSYDEFLGTAVIGLKIGKGGKKCLSLSSIGAFANFTDSDNFGLFLYLALNYPLGGPPFFFVTGISGGFGYNYRLIVPTLDELVAFPFVDEAVHDQKAPDPAESAQVLADELLILSNYMPPEVGAWFGAAGIKFTCFKIVDGFGLLNIALDSSGFEIDFIAIVTLMLPTTITGPFEPIAVAEMVMESRFAPAEGVLMVRGQLTPSSYVFSRECHLTGGYAFGLWFAGERAGDFVITQGGYHPRFYAAARYPDVPRLGYSWQIDDNAFTTAQVYFALCGYGVMVGGLFAIAFRAGALWAEFDAGIDFLISWKPYHYDVSWHFFVRAGIGALAVGLGVNVRFWGPDFGCKFKIRIIIITVTIKIGDQTSQYPNPIDWDEFRGAFLPPDDEVCSIAVVDGLSKQIIRETDGAEIWVINPKDLELTTDSIIPAKQVKTWGADQSVGTEMAFGINSMGIKKDELNTVHNVTITRDGSEEGAKEKFKFIPITKYAPVAAWGDPISSEHIVPPEPNDDPFIEDVFFSFQIVPAEQPKPGETDVIGVEHLLYDTSLIDNSYIWETIAAFIPDASLTTEEQKRDRINETVESNSQRDEVLSALGFDTSKVSIDPAVSDSFIFAPQVS